MNGLNRRMERTEGHINTFEDKTIEITEFKQQTGKRKEMPLPLQKRTSRTCGTI